MSDTPSPDLDVLTAYQTLANLSGPQQHVLLLALAAMFPAQTMTLIAAIRAEQPSLEERTDERPRGVGG